jgi:hypothetical protein
MQEDPATKSQLRLGEYRLRLVDFG